jgi:hypothetical protein
MAQKWFVQVEERIEGPMTKQEVESRLQAGQFTNHNLVWGAGMEHWRNLQWWSQESQTMTQFELTTTEAAREVWHYAVSGESHGPFQRDSLIESLKNLTSLGEVLLWTKGMKEWAPLFEFHEILTAIGVNKRQFPRADISGQATIKTNTGQTLVAPLLTVSEGGLGLQLEAEGLTAGMQVAVEISSPSFRSTLHARADVRYVAAGVTGLKFSNMSQEMRSAVVSYVRQSQTRFVLKAS